jgi:hypothetical protein
MDKVQKTNNSVIHHRQNPLDPNGYLLGPWFFSLEGWCKMSLSFPFGVQASASGRNHVVLAYLTSVKKATMPDTVWIAKQL